MRRLRLGAALASILTVAVIGVAPVASAARPTPPTVTVSGARIVGGGAAVEVKLRLTCPSRGEGLDYGFNVGVPSTDASHPETWWDATEITCSTSRPTTIVSLIPNQGKKRFKAGKIKVRVSGDNCHWTDASENFPGCFDLKTEKKVWLAKGRFLRPTMRDVDLDPQYVGARLLGNGSVRLRYQVTCLSEGAFGVPFATITQARKSGVVRSYAEAADYVECGTPSTQRVSFIVPKPAGKRFIKAPMVIKSEVSTYEGCFWEGCGHGHDSRVVKPRT